LALATTEIVPREGEVIGWKKCRDGRLVKLRIPPEAQRSNATGRKCRASCAEVLEIHSPFGGRCKTAESSHRSGFIYTVGETVACDAWEPDRLQECAGGIHFFLTREEAEDF
jgi:hypothetical protein